MRTIGRLSWLAVCLVGLAGVHPDRLAVLDHAAITVDRAEHRMRYLAGLPLRGSTILAPLEDRLRALGLKPGAPVLVRIFKRESELEIWLRRGDRFVLFATYPVCRWSGRLGPKLRQGDHQAPEGFYTVGAGQLNANSRWHRSFNLGFPNAFDRAHGRTGDFLMVHGGCSSVGCYAVTNAAVDEIWRLVTAALSGGQQRFQVQSYPFRLTAWNMRVHGSNVWHAFWSELKRGHDLFEESHVPPEISICDRRYAAAAGAPGNDGSRVIESRCPPTERLAAIGSR